MPSAIHCPPPVLEPEQYVAMLLMLSDLHKLSPLEAEQGRKNERYSPKFHDRDKRHRLIQSGQDKIYFNPWRLILDGHHLCLEVYTEDLLQEHRTMIHTFSFTNI